MSLATESCLHNTVDEVLGRHAPHPSSLIAVLQDLQEELNYLPEEALNQVATFLQMPRTQVYHVATFYKAFSLTQRGEHVISICRGTACHVQGAEKIADILSGELQIGDGETTSDGLFTLQSVRCLGCCSLAPAIMIDREVYGNLTSKSLRTILKQYQDKSL
jgi:NADH-quinone oxidoreductase subunit E